MIVEISQMPPDARVWIYQASQPINDHQKEILKESVTSFLSGWETHGNPLKASWNLYYNRFLVIAVDERYHSPSGCSIDKSVRFLKEMEEKLGISFLEKSSVATLESENQVGIYDLKALKQKVKEGIIKPETLVFNNLVPTLGEMEKYWKIPASQSWLSRYFSN